ncbi:protein PIF [Patella vulgata]|uniref:protein PIF n=1 Tax=Patella vulgata TaxID=6465 RepID=UPI00217FF5A7|nr:protein PIF [Patella vulgata]
MKNLVLVGVVALVALHTAFSDSTGCQQFIDVIAVVDGSDSVGPTEFQSVRDSLSDFVTALGVSSSVRFGVVVYSSTVGDVIPLSGDASDLTNKINNLNHARAGTATDLGIAKMIEMFSGSSSPKVGIVITDGESLTPSATLTQATNARNQNINMFAIGVGDDINSEELNGIASSSGQVSSVTDYTALAQQISSLVLEICPTTQPTTKPCDGCKMANGIGYNPHTDCDKYIQCEFTTDLTLLQYHVKQCGYGTFWNQDKLTCDHIGNVACDNDPCNTKVDGESYKTNGNCSQYYRCVDSKTQIRQCQPASSYDSFNGYCTVNTSCKSQPPIPVDCVFKERTNDRCHYDWVIPSGTVKMPCPGGTTFNQATCLCDTLLGASCYPACKPIVDIHFNADDVGEYDNYGAIIQNGNAYFNGNASIKILTLANVDFRSKINIMVRYRNEFYTFQEQAVVTNGDCGKQPSISITNRNNNVRFNLQDTTASAHTLDVKSYSQWRVARYLLKDGQFRAKVNRRGSSDSITVEARILRSQCAFILGQGTGFQNFKGWIDYITVSTC